MAKFMAADDKEYDVVESDSSQTQPQIRASEWTENSTEKLAHHKEAITVCHQTL
jgi:hypothetical protein